MRLLLLTLCVTILTGCGCNWHIKRVKDKCGYTSDTVRIVDTITVNSSSVDTLFRFTHSADTIVLRENGVVVKYFYNTKDSTVYLKGEREVVKVPYVKTLIKTKYKESIGKWYWFLLILVGIIFVIFLKR